MKIDVEHIAELAKLSLEGGNLPPKEEVQQHMETVIAQMTLSEVPSEDFATPENVMKLRPDVIEPSYPREEMIKNAPHKQAGCIVVPKIV